MGLQQKRAEVSTLVKFLSSKPPVNVLEIAAYSEEVFIFCASSYQFFICPRCEKFLR